MSFEVPFCYKYFEGYFEGYKFSFLIFNLEFSPPNDHRPSLHCTALYHSQSDGNLKLLNCDSPNLDFNPAPHHHHLHPQLMVQDVLETVAYEVDC